MGIYLASSIQSSIGYFVRLIVFFLLLVTSLLANDRPKIALVLSGGGARGAAHVGVLEILEKNHIPIDMIVGTSMGSFVGGLYASGKTPQEIAKMLVSTDWTKYITTDFKRQNIPMRKKELDYIYQGKIGLGINVDNEIVFPTGVLQREPLLLKFTKETQNVRNIKNFDNLSIPFRAVATNIKNGSSVILKSGSLAEAIYASSSIPGGFQPININGIELVDGGVSDNLPIQIAKDMGADIIIAVDVSENFDANLDVNSYLVVMGQLVNILMRKNANQSITLLKEDDILLTPDLHEFSGLDVDKYSTIIQRGVDITLKNLDRLKKLAISDKEYEKYKIKYRKKHANLKVLIDGITLVNNTYISDKSILERLHIKVGDTLDENKLREDILNIYHLMIFDSVTYKILKVDGKNIVEITTTPSWDNHGEIRAAIGIEDDFNGHSAYSLKLGYTMSAINSYGAEWRTNLEIGRRERVYSEFYQPLDPLQIFYLKPSLMYESIVDVFPIENYTANLVNGNVEVEYDRYGGSMALGMHMYRSLELEVGASSFKDSNDIHLDIKYTNPPFLTPKNNYYAKPIYASLKVDTLDNVNFPKYGVKSRVLWTKEGAIEGSDYNYEQVYIDFEKPLSFYSNNFTLHLKYANTYSRKDNTNRLYGTYTLGGLFNLSGYAPYSFNDDNMGLGVLKYRYQLKDKGFFGVLDTPLYIGFSLESGKTWGYKEKVDFGKFHNSATVYMAADTFFGPFYLAFAQADDGENSAYIYLGEKF